MISKHGTSLDIQSILSKLPFTTTGIPGELHLKLPGTNAHSFTGPGTRLDIRLNPDDTPRDFSKPINRIDEIAYKHDLDYREAGDDLEAKHNADRMMIQLLDEIKNPTIREIIERIIVKTALKTKLYFGVGLDVDDDDKVFKNKLIKYRQKIANELHREYRRPPIYLKVKVFEKDETWSADLVEMPVDNLGRSGKYKYILTCIDLYTKYGWGIPMRNKSANDTKEAFIKIFKESSRKPQKLFTDRGKEFYNKIMESFLEENNIKLYSTNNEGKAMVVERFNRTLKRYMWKKFTEVRNQKWVKLLQPTLDFYNNKIHRTIKTTPKEASEHPNKIKELVMKNNYENEHKMTKYQLKPKFHIGQRVRIYRFKTHFEKGFTYKWTNEIFKIHKILPTAPTTYELVDLNNEPIAGKFYANELISTLF